MIRSPAHDPWGRDLAGEVHELTFESEVLVDNPLGDPTSRPLYVYTPPGWPDDGPYPAVWSIQGMTGQIDMWRNRQAYASDLHRGPRPHDRRRRVPAGRDADARLLDRLRGLAVHRLRGTGNYMTYLCDELVPFVDEHFTTLAERDARAVQGKSSGGYGALVLPMLRPDLWGGLGDVSGDAAFEYCYLPDFPHRVGGVTRARLLDRGVLGEDARRPVAVRRHLRRGQHDRDGRLLLARARRRARAAVLRNGRLAARGRLGALAGLGSGPDDRRPPRRAAHDARDLARVRPPGRVQPVCGHRDPPRAARARRASSTATSSSRASTVVSPRATRRLSPGWRSGSRRTASSRGTCAGG